jgi:hypothetical protein
MYKWHNTEPEDKSNVKLWAKHPLSLQTLKIKIKRAQSIKNY